MNRENYSELLELIELAEKVSEKTEFYKNRLFNLRLQFVIFSIVALILFMLSASMALDYALGEKNQWFIVESIGLIGFALYIFIIVRQISRNRKYYYHERKTLSRLLEMTHEFKNIAFGSNNLSVIEKAMVEMRLSRINFDE